MTYINNLCKSFYVSLFMHDIYHSTISATFIELFTLSNIHHYQTRQANKQAYFNHYPRTNHKLHFITNQGIKLGKNSSRTERSE